MSTDLKIQIGESDNAAILATRIQAARKDGDTSALFKYEHQGVDVGYVHEEGLGSSTELARRAIKSINYHLKRLGKTLLAA